MDTRATIRAFVEKELRRRSGGKPIEFSDDESLFLSSRTDSLFFIDLMIFLGKSFSITLNQAALAKEDLDSVEKMVKLVESAKRR